MNPRPPQTADLRTAMPSAIATVVAYRALTLWPLVPAGWVVWWRLDVRHLALAPTASCYRSMLSTKSVTASWRFEAHSLRRRSSRFAAARQRSRWRVM
jgi:hypothetical protein